MLSKFISYFQQHVDLTEKDIEFIQETISIKKYKKGEFLLKEGEVSKAFFFNLSGFVRLFYINDGEERTAYFYREGLFISAYASFLRQTPSQFYLQATEDTEVVVIGFEEARQFLAYSNKFEVLARIAMEEELIQHQDIIASLLTMKPEDRYFHLLKTNPTIFQKVPQAQIASYIGVQPESLSRIKKRAYQKS